METIKDRLSCYDREQEYTVRKSISVSENGKKYLARFNPQKLSASFQVDGYIINDGQRCDKLIIFQGNAENQWSEIFVELKGQNISHAIEQLEATLKRDVFKTAVAETKRARIVGKSFPKSTGNSVLDRAKIRFLKNYKCDLRTSHSDSPETIQ